ncbi:transposase, partial [Pseudomonas aeruginosa]
MTCATDFLPDDIQALKALVTAQRGEIEHLKLMIAKLRRMQFGRRSEQLDGMLDQLQLTLEELQVSQAALASPPPAQSRPRTPVRRKPLPEHLPREIHVHRPDAQCPGCGGELR